jgi:hypothetical protein
MAGGKPTRNVPYLPQGRRPVGGRAASGAPSNATPQMPADPAPATDRAGTRSPPDEATISKPVETQAESPVEAKDLRFRRLPSWASLPRDVLIALAAIIAAGVIILLVLSAQWPGAR